MGDISYKAEVTLVFVESDAPTRRTPVRSFSVAGGSSKPVDLNSTNDANLLHELELAKSKKNITLMKTP